MVAMGQPFFSLKNLYLGENQKYTISAPFLSNLYIYTILVVTRGNRPLAKGNFIFGALNLHNFRPFCSLTFYKDIGLFGGGLKDTPAPPLKILRDSAPDPPVPKPI